MAFKIILLLLFLLLLLLSEPGYDLELYDLGNLC